MNNNNIDYCHHDTKTLNEYYYQVLNDNRQSGKTYQIINMYEEKYKDLQTRWNSLREWLEEQHQFIIEIPAYTKEISIEHKTMEICYENVLDKMNELESSDNK